MGSNSYHVHKSMANRTLSAHTFPRVKVWALKTSKVAGLRSAVHSMTPATAEDPADAPPPTDTGKEEDCAPEDDAASGEVEAGKPPPHTGPCPPKAPTPAPPLAPPMDAVADGGAPNSAAVDSMSAAFPPPPFHAGAGPLEDAAAAFSPCPHCVEAPPLPMLVDPPAMVRKPDPHPAFGACSNS